MLTLQEIGEQTRNAIQLLIDRFDLGLGVGPLKDADYRLLASGMFGDLNWDWGVGQYTGHEDTFELCFKIVAEVEGYPAGIALCAYRTDTQTFEIYMLENFVKDEVDHPLYKRMALFTFIGAYIFTDAVLGTQVVIVEPDPDLIGYYSKFGFQIDPSCTYRMQCALDDLKPLLTDIEKFMF